MRVLLVEDHARLAMALAAGLRQAGMAVDVVFDGDDALEHAAVTAYDVVVLDRDIPGVHGDDVCKQIAAGGSPSRVLMLTAAGAVEDRVEDRVEGLGIGADDYLPKPCDFSELVARVRALARRPGAALPPLLSSGDITLDPSRRAATRAGRRLPLNPRELAVLEVLLSVDGAVVSAEEILQRVWDEFADPFSQAVRTTISRLRAKLGDPPVIETVPKAGYRIGR
jgi:DNA-binding response OmpR family regulator